MLRLIQFTRKNYIELFYTYHSLPCFTYESFLIKKLKYWLYIHIKSEEDFIFFFA